MYKVYGTIYISKPTFRSFQCTDYFVAILRPTVVGGRSVYTSSFLFYLLCWNYVITFKLYTVQYRISNFSIEVLNNTKAYELVYY